MVSIDDTTTSKTYATTSTTTGTGRYNRQRERRRLFTKQQKTIKKEKNKTKQLTPRSIQRHYNHVKQKQSAVMIQIIEKELQRFNIIHTIKQKNIIKRIQYHFGYVANEPLQVSHNAALFLGNMSTSLYFSRPSNIAFHDLQDETLCHPCNSVRMTNNI